MVSFKGWPACLDKFYLCLDKTEHLTPSNKRLSYMTPVCQTGYSFVVKWCSPVVSCQRNAQTANITHLTYSCTSALPLCPSILVYFPLLLWCASIPSNFKHKGSCTPRAGNPIGCFSPLKTKQSGPCHLLKLDTDWVLLASCMVWFLKTQRSCIAFFSHM